MSSLALHVLLALATIMLLARATGFVFERFLRQPPVMGEIVLGIALGPSALGRLSPGASSWLFSADVMSHVGVLANLGVVLFLFLVGLELDVSALRSRSRAAVSIALASIAVPGGLGVALGFWLAPSFAGTRPPLVFSLFVGTSLAVTAFPVLARILADRGLAATRFGQLALGCAAITDALAWVLLAFVTSTVTAQLGSALRTLALFTVYALGMALVVRPLVLRVVARVERRAELSRGWFAASLVALIASALVTESIGVHALFGAFAMGSIVPHDSLLARGLRKRLEDVTVVLLLPAFFAKAGMFTEIGLVTGHDWLVLALIVLVATAGKMGGSAIAARASGFGWRASASIGVLMNTRGLMELVVLDVGREMGILPPALFTMLVLMALVTTLMTSPLLGLVMGRESADAIVPPSAIPPRVV